MSGTDLSPLPSDIAEIRSRLRRAGLLSDFEPRSVVRPDDDTVAAARRRAGQGTMLSELVRANRR